MIKRGYLGCFYMFWPLNDMFKSFYGKMDFEKKSQNYVSYMYANFQNVCSASWLKGQSVSPNLPGVFSFFSLEASTGPYPIGRIFILLKEVDHQVEVMVNCLGGKSGTLFCNHLWRILLLFLNFFKDCSRMIIVVNTSTHNAIPNKIGLVSNSNSQKVPLRR